jgi:hypothetical protein
MPRNSRFDAIVLRTVDIGEADRFCILLTRERGRLAARANGVRRPRSHIGACLLPMHRITVEVTETRRNFIITDARRHVECRESGTLETFLVGQELIELLLLLLHDGEPLPEVFDFAAEFLRTAQGQSRSSLPSRIRLLRLLGHMPERGNPLLSALSPEEYRTVEQWATSNTNSVEVLSRQAERSLQRFCDTLLHEHAGRHGKVPLIAETMRTHRIL